MGVIIHIILFIFNNKKLRFHSSTVPWIPKLMLLILPILTTDYFRFLHLEMSSKIEKLDRAYFWFKLSHTSKLTRTESLSAFELLTEIYTKL